jgi:hypothetical protein
MKFTLRDALLTFGVIGLALGWIIDHRRLATPAERYYQLKADMEGRGFGLAWRNVAGQGEALTVTPPRSP